jgi:hypothetical protein
VGTELFQLDPGGGVAAILFGGVTGNTGRSLVEVGSTFSAFQRNDNSYAFILSHSFTDSAEIFSTQSPIIS